MNKQQKIKHWQGIFEQQKSSGLAIIQFCRDNNINASTFYVWRKRLSDETIRVKKQQVIPFVIHEQAFTQPSIIKPNASQIIERTVTPCTHQVYLVTGFTDMRKSINGLSIIVSDTLSLDPLSQAWFVFCNKQRDKLKILFWDTNGFWLYYRRLEQGRFQWPNHAQAHVAMGIEQRQLQWLLSGLPVNNKTRHSTLSGLSVI